MENTFYYDSQRQEVPDISNAMFKIHILKNPYEYNNKDLDLIKSSSSSSGSSSSGSSNSGSSSSGSSSSDSSNSGSSSSGSDIDDFLLGDMAFPNATKMEWNRTARSIRNCNFRMCQGGINTGFFSGDSVNNSSVIFLLYYITQKRAGVAETLIGFSQTLDLRTDKEDHGVEEGTLYIDAICTNTKIRDLPDGGLKGAGTLLMKQIEEYALDPLNELDGEPFTNIKLSALPYVISYYRRLGYRHVHNCGDIVYIPERPLGSQYIERDIDIMEMTDIMNEMKIRFKTDDDLDFALKIELAKEKIMFADGIDRESILLDYLILNLNEYFTPDNIIFMRNDIDGIPGLLALDKGKGKEPDKINHNIMELLGQDNKILLEFLNMLRVKGFSVSCDEKQVRFMRHNTRKDSDGDIDFHCLDEGYTMRKCLYVERGVDAGRGYQPKKIKYKYINMGKRKSRKKVPWAGWSKISPKGRARTVMKRKCGKKCFLGPNKSFPVCARGTCKVNKKGLWAAYIRAKEWGNKRKSYKGKARPRHSRKVYQRIARTAKRKLK